MKWFTLLVILFLMVGSTACVQQQQAVAPVNNSGTPGWIDLPPTNHSVGSASYAATSIADAKKRSVGVAISNLVTHKAGEADVEQTLESETEVLNKNVSKSASISTNATIRGKNILINIKVIEFYKDQANGEIYVLIQDLAPKKKAP